MKTADHAGSTSERRGRRIPIRVTGALATGSVLQPLNSSMIAVAIVAISTQFGSLSNLDVSWVISAMYIATAAGAPAAGRLGSLFGARRVFLAGLVLVAIGSVLGMTAPNLSWLIAAYALIGVGVSAHMPTAMTIVRSYGERYGRRSQTALTTLLVCGQSVSALGPAIGGVLVGTFGWQAILWVNLPVVVISAIAVLCADVGFAGRKRISLREAFQALDVAGIILFLVAIIANMVLLVNFHNTTSWWLVTVAALGLGSFVWWERRASAPFFDVRSLSRNRTLAYALGRTLTTYTCFYCVFFGIPQWLQHARGMTAIETGMMMLPVAAVSAISTYAAAWVYRRSGARWTLFVGTFALLVGGVLMIFVERDTPVIVILVLAAILGIPHGFSNVGNQNLINEVTSVDEVGTAIGMYRTMAFIGANVAVVVLQLTAGTEFGDSGLYRVGWFIVSAAALLLVGLALSCRVRTSNDVRQ